MNLNLKPVLDYSFSELAELITAGYSGYFMEIKLDASSLSIDITFELPRKLSGGLPGVIEGMMALLLSDCRWRASQPLEPVVSPGVPCSNMAVDSK